MDNHWIDEYVDGIIDYCYSRDIFEIYSALKINLKRIDKGDPILLGNDALYIRSYLGFEAVFIRDDFAYRYEKFILAHELGHAVLHTGMDTAAYNNKLVNKGKLERQADYFAFRLLNIPLDKVFYEGYTLEQISKALYVSENSLGYFI